MYLHQFLGTPDQSVTMLSSAPVPFKGILTGTVQRRQSALLRPLRRQRGTARAVAAAALSSVPHVARAATTRRTLLRRRAPRNDMNERCMS